MNAPMGRTPLRVRLSEKLPGILIEARIDARLRRGRLPGMRAG
jgi:hypothetical protein